MARRGSSDILGFALIGGAGYLAWRYMKGDYAAASPPSSTATTAPPATPTQSAPAPGAPSNAPRGIRNNNPGNILYSPANNWQGQTGSDGSYAKFSSPVYGIRAEFILLKNYHANYGINTLSQIAARWAPAPMNVPANWAANVASYSGIAPGATVDFNNGAVMIALAKGITVAENGAAYFNYYPDSIYQSAWAAS